MITYGPIEFACPPYCPAEWFRHAMWLCGLNGLDTDGDPYRAFPKERSDSLRVSLVAHPCVWTESFCGGHPNPQLALDVMFADYFRSTPGMVSGLYEMYEADTVLRVEDQPGAMLELLVSLGLVADGLKHLTPPVMPPKLKWKPEVRVAFIRAEREVCERYDYY